MKKARIFLCGITSAIMLCGCGAVVPDLTEEETNMISEYAVGILLKYDKNYDGRLLATAVYAAEEPVVEEPVIEPEPEEPEQTETAGTTEIIDVSEEENLPATVEEYYGINGIVFQYSGYELTDSYPASAEGDDLFFSLDATEGTKLLVLKFAAVNQSGSDQTLNMLGHGARFRVSVNGEASKGTLATMLLNDMQTYEGTIAAGASVELVSIVEIPADTNVETINYVLRGGEGDAVMNLQ